MQALAQVTAPRGCASICPCRPRRTGHVRTPRADERPGKDMRGVRACSPRAAPAAERESVDAHLHARARLLPRLARGAGGRPLANLQVAGWERPEAAARLDRPLAQQNPALVLHNAAHDLHHPTPDCWLCWGLQAVALQAAASSPCHTALHIRVKGVWRGVSKRRTCNVLQISQGAHKLGVAVVHRAAGCADRAPLPLARGHPHLQRRPALSAELDAPVALPTRAL